MAKRNPKTQKLVLMALLAAIIIIFQLIGCIPQISAAKISLVLVPIVIGACALGPVSGMILGTVFGAVVFLYGLFGIDASTQMLIQINFLGTLVNCVAKGLLAGLLSGLVFKALKRINFYVGILAAAIVCPVVNTSVYCACMVIFFRNFLINNFKLGESAGFAAAVWFVFIIIMVNFIVELIINVIICPVIGGVLKKGKFVDSWRELS